MQKNITKFATKKRDLGTKPEYETRLLAKIEGIKNQFFIHY